MTKPRASWTLVLLAVVIVFTLLSAQTTLEVPAEELSLELSAASPVEPHGGFPYALTYGLLTALGSLCLLNALWRPSRRPRLYLAADVRLRGRLERQRMWITRASRRRVTFFAEEPAGKGTSISVSTGALGTGPSHFLFGGRIIRCRPLDGWYEIEATLQPKPESGKGDVGRWLTTLRSSGA